MSEFKVYVADLAEYNAGCLVGAWLTPSDYASEEDFSEAIQKVMKAPGNEYAFHDSEGIPVKECVALDRILNIAEAVEDHGVDKVKAFLDYGEDNDGNDSLSTQISDRDGGTYRNKEEWAMELIEDYYDTKKMGALANYIDYEAYARDAELNGDVRFYELGYNEVWALNHS